MCILLTYQADRYLGCPAYSSLYFCLLFAYPVFNQICAVRFTCIHATFLPINKLLRLSVAFFILLTTLRLCYGLLFSLFYLFTAHISSRWFYVMNTIYICLFCFLSLFYYSLFILFILYII